MSNRIINAEHTVLPLTRRHSLFLAPRSTISLTVFCNWLKQIEDSAPDLICSKSVMSPNKWKRIRCNYSTSKHILTAASAAAVESPPALLASIAHNPKNYFEHILTELYNVTKILFLKLTRSSVLIAITLLVLCTACGAASPCESHSWWNPVKDKCIPCTVCQGELIPLRPCQLHRDTICGSIYDLKIDWVVLTKTEPNWKERRKPEDETDYSLEQQLTQDQLHLLHEESVSMDWQTVSLFLAVLACLIFFIIAACILVHHMRQWRRMERRLDQDVEELSSKLMAKLAEVQYLDGGTFFIGSADALRMSPTYPSQHVLLPETPIKHHERSFMKILQPGNVYIEGNGSKG